MIMRFSLVPGFKDGPFRNVDEVKDAALACVKLGPSPIGVVETEDEPEKRSNAKFEIFRKVDDMEVPGSIEWVTVLHADVVANMAVDLRQLTEVDGVRVGTSREHWWVILW